jgi:hypothetical protein
MAYDYIYSFHSVGGFFIDLEKFYQTPDGRRTQLNGFVLLAEIISKHLKVIYERLDYLELYQLD